MKTKVLKNKILWAFTIALSLLCAIFAFSFMPAKHNIVHAAQSGIAPQAETATTSFTPNWNTNTPPAGFTITASNNAKISNSGEYILANLSGENKLTLNFSENVIYAVPGSTSPTTPINTFEISEEGEYAFASYNNLAIGFTLNVLSIENYPKITNGKFYSYNIDASIQPNVNVLTYYFDGNLVDYFNKTATTTQPIVTLPASITIDSATFIAYNANASTNLTIESNKLNVNNFGTYEINWTNENQNYKAIIYSFGAKNMFSDQYHADDSTNTPPEREMTDETTKSTSRTTLTAEEAKTATEGIVHTNQVPSWIDYFAMQNGLNVDVQFLPIGSYGKNSNNNIDWQHLSPYRLSLSGRYYITVNGTAPNNILGGRPFTNTFVFDITSANPNLTYKTISHYENYDGNYENNGNIERTLSSGDYTNGSVTISQKGEKSPFDKPYIITYTKEVDGFHDTEYTEVNGNKVLGRTYKQDDASTPDINEAEVLGDDIENGHYAKYTITVHFGTNESRVVAEFTVDKTPIEITPYFGNGKYQENENQILNPNNGKFFLTFTEKASRAKIAKAMYRHYKFEQDESVDDNAFESGNNIYVQAKYKLSNISTDVEYNILSNEQSTNQHCLTEPGLYEFEIRDEADNTAFYYVYLDNFTPNIIIEQPTTTNNNNYVITYGNYKAISVEKNNLSLKRGNVYGSESNVTSTNDIIATDSSNNYYLTTQINYPKGANFYQQLREADASGKISTTITNAGNADTTHADFLRLVTNSKTYIRSNNINNEGLYSFTIKDINNNESNTEQIAISFDLANVQIGVNVDGQFKNLTSGSVVTGTSFNNLVLDGATISGIAEGIKPAFELTNLTVDFYERVNSDTTYFATTKTASAELFNSTTKALSLGSIFKKLNLLNNNQNGLYLFKWHVDITGNSGQFKPDRLQYIIVDDGTLYAREFNPTLSFQDKKTLELIGEDNFNNINNGIITPPDDVVASSNLTPIELKNYGTHRISADILNNPINDGDDDKKIDHLSLMKDLFELTKKVDAVYTNGSAETIDNATTQYISAGDYAVSLSDQLNNLIVLNGKQFLGAGKSFSFNINRIKPSANFVDGNKINGDIENVKDIPSGAILSYNQVEANGQVYGVTAALNAIDASTASVNSSYSNLIFSFDKDVVYESENKSGTAEFSPVDYPYNATIDLNNVKINDTPITYEENNPTNRIKKYEFKDINDNIIKTRYYITDLLENANDGDVITIELTYEAGNYGYTENLTQIYTLYVDNTAPQYNLERVRFGDDNYQGDTFYQANEQNIKKAGEDKYFYTLQPEFVFETATETDSSPAYLDTYKIFYRIVNNPIYNDKGEAVDNTLKTISANNKNAATHAGPVFDESKTSIYRAFNYGKQAGNLFTTNVVYEIVELDLAGNLTSYFVCLKDVNSSLELTLSADNYLDNDNNNLTTKSIDIKSNSSTTDIYSVNNNFRISNMYSPINNYFVYSIEDITTDADGNRLNTTPLCENKFAFINNAIEMTNEINGVLTDYRNGDWKADGAVFEISIYDRISENYLIFNLYNRPQVAQNFWPMISSNDIVNEALGSILPNSDNTLIIVTNPTFNSSFSYSSDGGGSYSIKNIKTNRNLENIYTTSGKKNEITITKGQTENYLLSLVDNYGFKSSHYFSSKLDYAKFTTTNKTIKLNKNDDEFLDSLLSTLQLVSLDFYADDLTFEYHTEFKDPNKIKVELYNVNDDAPQWKELNKNQQYTLDETNGKIIFPKVENAFYIYKVTIGYQDKLQSNKPDEVVYGAYYTSLPQLVVKDRYDKTLYFNTNKIRTTYADVSFAVNNLNEKLGTKVYSSVTNTLINNQKLPTEPEEEVINHITLQILDGNYKISEYNLRITNNLGYEKIYNITIDSTHYPIYQFAQNNGEGDILYASSKSFNTTYNGKAKQGDQYFTNDRISNERNQTITNTQLILAIDKPLQYEVIEGWVPNWVNIENNNEIVAGVSVIDSNGNVINDSELSEYNRYFNYTIFRITSRDISVFNEELFVKLNYVPQTNNLTNLFTTMSYALSTELNAEKSLTQTYNYKGDITSYPGLDYYAEIRSGSITKINRSGTFTLSDAGVYQITYKDIAGNTHIFINTNQDGVQIGETSIQTINLLNKVLFNVDGDNYSGELIDSMALQNNFTITLQYMDLYNSLYSNFNITASYNGSKIEDFNGSAQTFSNGGVYEIIATTTTGDITTQISKYTIYLVKPNEQRLGLEFNLNNLNNTTSFVTKVTRKDFSNPTTDGTPVTNLFRIKEGIDDQDDVLLTKLRMSPYESGTGLYTVEVSTNFLTEYKQNFSYTFSVLILDTDPIVSSNIAYGSETSKNIVLSWVPSDIYLNYGEVDIKIGDNVYSVREIDKINDIMQSETIRTKGTYNIDILTPSGMILTRYTITKNNPLGVVEIVLIVVGSVALVAGVLLFFLLRNKMKVK